jgi:hypothetical protein
MAPVASPSNPHKRHIDAVQRVYDIAKRPKPSHESSASAPGAIPGHHSASAPTPAEPSEQESDSESDLSESSEEPSDESDVEESEEGSDDGSHDDGDEEGENTEDAVVNLRANRGERPSYKLPDDEALEDIRPFLKDFIPKLKAANEELEAQKKAGTLKTSEIVGEDDGNGQEEYIEMVSSWLPAHAHRQRDLQIVRC